jgi:hypothetical protein
MKQQLVEFASIRFGVHAKALEQGSMALVPASAIGEHGDILTHHLRRIAPEVVRCQPADLLQAGDVLLVGKGNVNHAAVWPTGFEDTLASNTLFVIRPNRQQVLPEYLVGYLNSAPAQAWFTTHRKTGTVQVLSREALNELLVPVPPLATQQRMVKLTHAAQRAIQQITELSNAHAQLLNTAWAQLNDQ